jgi:endonuclease/exonuclease/phosphatase (EEP) superfamily protein YafD
MYFGKLIRVLVRIVALVALGLLLAGYDGALHPAGDSLAMVRLPAGLVLFLAVVWIGGPGWLRFAGVAVAVLAVGGVAARAWLPGQAGGLSVYQKNLWVGNVANADLIADIIDSEADIVLLQEISSRNVALLARLQMAFPYQNLCRFSGGSGIAVLSRWPAIGPGICSDGRGMAGLQVETPEGRVWALSIHLHWPYPHRQRMLVDALLPIIGALDGPVIMGGDFNMVPWGASVRQMAAATGTSPARPLFPTILVGPMPLSIDYILAPGGGLSERRPRLGSDHYGVLARVALPPG